MPIALSHSWVNCYCRRYSLQEVLAILDECEEDVSNIFIDPPDTAINSDEDPANEDAGGLIDNLSGAKLRSHAEVVFRDGHQLGEVEGDEDSTLEGDLIETEAHGASQLEDTSTLSDAEKEPTIRRGVVKQSAATELMFRSLNFDDKL